MKRHAYVLVLSRYERQHRRFVRLPDATVLGWFRRNWKRTTEQREEELKGSIYGLESVFDDTFEDRPVEPPKADATLVDLIARTIYAEGDHDVQPHLIKVQTDDDEYPIHYYFFDDDFLDTPDAWDELPNWRTGTAQDVLADPHGDSSDDDDADDDADDEGKDADAFERFYRSRTGR